jgi:hypothetical protein
MNSVLELGNLDSQTFEQMVNSLALSVLGAGLMSFGPGADGGRDGYFVGAAPYPSMVESWSGTWYIQSKFHAPHLSSNHQEWFLKQVEEELELFGANRRRRWPDIWIVATNIDPSGVPETGCFDKAVKLVSSYRPALANRFHIWGGRKILDLLGLHPQISHRYGHFLTPGNVLHHIVNALEGEKVSPKKLLDHLVVDSLHQNRRMRLDQAGDAGPRPDMHLLYVDLPFSTALDSDPRYLLEEVTLACSEHFGNQPEAGPSDNWRRWLQDPMRAQAWLVLAGPGAGKTTLGQFLGQIHRASFLLEENLFDADFEHLALARSIRERALELRAWPRVPRLPLHIDLSQYAQWYNKRQSEEARGILTYLANKYSASLEESVTPSSLRAAIKDGRWLLICDGLDEVPGEIKEEIATEISEFVVAMRRRCDLFTLCTSRPQGYSGQLKELGGAELNLLPLPAEIALDCADRLFKIYAPGQEAIEGHKVLERAVNTPAVRQLMTTPLQVHIMTIIVRQGQHPPEKKWELFQRFYEVIYLREAAKSLGGAPEAAFLRDERKLIAAVHKALGFVLHARAETSAGSPSSLSRHDFEELVFYLVSQWKISDIDKTCLTVRRASTDRLVLINTPDSKDSVRYDVRQLQEFFAAGFMVDGVTAEQFRERLETIVHDSHWREVVHFALSSIIENNRETEIAVSVDVLARINDTSLYGEERAIGNSILAGSIVAANLLADGVLDPDRRTRDRFRSLIKMLGASRAYFQISSLLEVNGKDSEAWLIDLMREHVEESAPEYSVGATVLLFCLSPKDAPSVLARWNGWSVDLVKISHMLLSRCLAGSRLFSESLFLLLSHPYMGLLFASHVGFSVMRYQIVFAESLSWGHFTADLNELLALAERTIYGTGKQMDYEGVTVWENTSDLTYDASEVSLAERVLASGCSGFFEFLARLVVFAGRRDRRSCLELLKAALPIPLVMNRVNFLSKGRHIFAISGSDDLERLISHVESTDEERFAAALAEGSLVPWAPESSFHVMSVRVASGMSTDYVATLLKTHPRSLLPICAMEPQVVTILANEHPELVRDVFEKHQQFFVTHPSTWAALGKVLGDDPNAVLSDLAADSKFRFTYEFSRSGEQVAIALPANANLLCPIAGSVAGPLRWRHRPDKSSDFYAQEAKSASAAVARWIRNVADLVSMISSAYSSDIKMSACVIGVMHPEGGIVFLERNLIEILKVSESAGREARLGLVCAVDAIGGLSHDAGRRLIDAIIAVDRFGGWEAAAEVWFSRSRGVVARAGKIARWLNAGKSNDWLVPV